MPDLLRLIDANLNRAREGLRVMEDVARFLLDDGALAAALKEARHELRAIAAGAGLDATVLAAWRDTPADVGTGTTSDGELSRMGTREVAIAAGKRAAEALRVLEEGFKALPGGEVSGRVKQLRYRVYESEKRLLLALGSGAARQWRLCVIVTEALCTLHRWDRVAELALEGGADCLQLREKALESRELLRRAERLVAIARGAGPERAVGAVINDRPDIAALSGADGVHIGQSDLSVADVRRIAGSRLLVGVSTTNLEEARAAAEAGADYCGVGPMFETRTKEKAVAGPQYLRAYLADERTARVPHLAIGGIDAERAGELAAIGCRGVAVSSAVCGAEEPARVCREIAKALAKVG